MGFGGQGDFVTVFEKRTGFAVGSVTGSFPPWPEFHQAAFGATVGPEMVPLPSKSPGCRSHPLLVWWVIICATLQYMWRLDEREIGCASRRLCASAPC